MQPMRHSFILLQYIGMWRPEHWLPGWKWNLYYCYTFIIVLLMGTTLFSELVGLINSTEDIEAFANNSFLLMTMFGDSGKALNIMMKRGEIIALINVLQEYPCRPRTDEEIAIQHKFDKSVRSTTLGYFITVGLTVAGLIWKTTVEIPTRSLPYDAWIPFDYESVLSYFYIWGHQNIATAVGAGFCACFDTLVSGFMLQTCSQLHILKHRFHEVPNILINNDKIINDGNKVKLFSPNLESELLSECVKHHLEIFKFAEKANELFSIMIFIQYSISTMVLCLCVFGLSTLSLFSPEFTAMFGYTLCMGVQIFVYCYYGGQVSGESLAVGDAVYETNWDFLSLKARRSLLMIMARTLRPIEFTSGYVLTLNLQYFNSLLKLSYSAYNVLQRSSK